MTAIMHNYTLVAWTAHSTSVQCGEKTPSKHLPPYCKQIGLDIKYKQQMVHRDNRRFLDCNILWYQGDQGHWYNIFGGRHWAPLV